MVVDAGASWGSYYCLPASRVGRRIYAFEPDTAYYPTRLRVNIKENKLSNIYASHSDCLIPIAWSNGRK